jgi:prefoldin subunit 5
MNKNTRRKLMGISAQVCAYKESIEDLKNDVEAIRDEEEEKYDNLPEGLQESEMGETLQEVYDKLGSIASSLDMIVDDLGSVAEELDEVVTL